MKKTLLTIAIVLGMTIGAMAQEKGGMFQRGAMPDEMNYEYGNNNRDGGLILPGSHGQTGDAGAPLGSGIAVLMGLGAAYLVGKRRKEE